MHSTYGIGPPTQVLLLGGDRADAAQWERRCSAVAGSRLRVKSMAASPRSAAALAEADAANADAIIIAGTCVRSHMRWGHGLNGPTTAACD